jgi:hypoxanthine phosphoribosyltransferase|tara:strand:+ start:10637 stop:11098 length:462 start_codon:yes stop_codon:yes gene_type:complete
MAESKLRHIGWVEYEELVTHCAAQLCTMDPPDAIVGISRGGLIPAVRISNVLGIPMETINLSLRDGQISGSAELFEAQLKNLDKYPRIAVIDDICDSGKTLHILDIHLQERGHTHIKWCTLLHKTTAMFTPSIIGETIGDLANNDWVVFPWED